ncbi:hypothetical protein CPB83DRAFT_65312 [Crepidotus variabilis]|uniref:ADF-H domain-containing protein n=1 Tax=Crepidotus variabilis TaxID=179855 RepID=A0A9P6E607_9AGAR|nr:hypothetical protein CPB83DRAFT_65312 [Crepidotus variabilis]
MANLNLADPAAISAVYSSILDNDNNWLLLHYENDAFDEIGLHSYGGQGLEEMKTKISSLEDVFIAFYREELENDPGYIIINYVPPTISAVKRAKVLVHSRRVGAILKQHQTIFTVDSLSLITSSNIYAAIKNPNTAFQPLSPTPSQLIDTLVNTSLTEVHDQPLPPARPLPTAPTTKREESLSPRRPLQPLRAASQLSSDPPATESTMGARSPYASPSREGLPQAVPLFPKGFFHNGPPSSDGLPPQAVPLVPKGFLSNFIKKKKKGSRDSEDGPPPPTPSKGPPTPPKDKDTFPVYTSPMGHSYSQPTPQSSKIQPVRRQRSQSFSEFAVISHPVDRVDMDDMVIVDSDSVNGSSQLYTLPLKGKWASTSANASDPEARAQRRSELRWKRQEEERRALESEVRRQRKLKAEREAILRQEAEEERRRKLELEEEVQRIKEHRRRKEQWEAEEEERKQQELEDRRRMNRDRRLEEHRKLELWREEQARKAEAAARQVEEARRREEAERKTRIQQVAAKLKGSKEDSDLSGWITILNTESLAWKRRYYKFVGNRILLFRHPNDTQPALDQAELKGNLKALKEWREGYEDLEAIPYSFVVEFKDGREVWSMYADSEGEKYKILGLFKIAGTL